MALRTPTKGQPLGTYNRSTRESHRVQGLRSKLSLKKRSEFGFGVPGESYARTKGNLTFEHERHKVLNEMESPNKSLHDR